MGILPNWSDPGLFPGHTTSLHKVRQPMRWPTASAPGVRTGQDADEPDGNAPSVHNAATALASRAEDALRKVSDPGLQTAILNAVAGGRQDRWVHQEAYKLLRDRGWVPEGGIEERWAMRWAEEMAR